MPRALVSDAVNIAQISFASASRALSDADFAIPHEFQPANGFVRLFNSRSKFRNKLCARASALRCAVVGPGRSCRLVELNPGNLCFRTLWKFPVESTRGECKSVCTSDELRWLLHSRVAVHERRPSVATHFLGRNARRCRRVRTFCPHFLLSTFYFLLSTY